MLEVSVLKQKYFDKAVAGLASQGFVQSTGTSMFGDCAYRGINGLKCAVGHLIDDSEYDPEYEGSSVEVVLRECDTSIGREILSLSEKEQKDMVSFLAYLQIAHDNYSEPEEMKLQLFHVATTNNLVIPDSLNV